MDAPLCKGKAARQKISPSYSYRRQVKFIMPGKTKSILSCSKWQTNSGKTRSIHTHTHTQSAYFEWHLRPNDKSRLAASPENIPSTFPKTHTLAHTRRDIGQTLAHRLGPSAVIVVFQFEWFNIKRAEERKGKTHETGSRQGAGRQHNAGHCCGRPYKCHDEATRRWQHAQKL